MKALLFELGVEEIPARLLSRAQRELGERLVKALADAKLEFADLQTFATPRRLALSISIADAQPDIVEERLGPPARIAFDDKGQPTKAAIGFAARQGVSVDALERRATPKGDYLGVTVETLGQKSDALLPGILKDIITQLHWPKAMRWASGRETFIRPVQWILACFDGAVVPITFAGVQSGETTRGHRFMAPDTVAVHDVETYLTELRARFVEPDPERRKAEIKIQTEELAAQHGVEAIITPELLEEVTGLVEWPFVHLGSFDEDALGLPSEVLITSMNVHQRYFAVRSTSGALAAHFIVVAGTQVEDPAVVIAGNARVLAARLADARFFYDSDIGRPLDSFVPALQGRRFLEGLGTMADKATRLKTMSQRISTHINEDLKVAERAGRAGWLAKADLATAMVGEFAKLQGVMGQDYATRSGESKAVADAVFEHYLPRFAGDELAQSDEGTSVALSDRMDSLMGCFTLGLEPTGSADPYALRRQALGVVRMQRNSERVPALSTLIDVAAETYQSAGVAIDAEAMSRLTAFFRGRMKAAFAQEQSSDLVEAVLAVSHDHAFDVDARLEALVAAKQAAGWEDLAALVKRVANITEDVEPSPLEPDGFTEPAAADLYRALEAVQAKARPLLDAKAYREGLTQLATLKGPIDRFFDEVLVMSKEPAERARRLALLTTVGRLFSRVAAFDKVST